jgi:uncharacterized protein YxjI
MSIASQRKFLIRQKLVSIKDKNYILNSQQEQIGYFIRTLLAVRATYRLKTMADETKFIVQHQIVAARPTFRFYRVGSDQEDEPCDENYVGSLKQKFISLGPSFWFEFANAERLFELKGNPWALNYKFVRGNEVIGTISRKLFSIRDYYGIELAASVPDEEALTMLATVIVLHYLREERH